MKSGPSILHTIAGWRAALKANGGQVRNTGEYFDADLEQIITLFLLETVRDSLLLWNVCKRTDKGGKYLLIFFEVHVPCFLHRLQIDIGSQWAVVTTRGDAEAVRLVTQAG